MKLLGQSLFLHKPLAAELVVFFCRAEELSFIPEQTALVCHPSMVWEISFPWRSSSRGEDIVFWLKTLPPASVMLWG